MKSVLIGRREEPVELGIWGCRLWFVVPERLAPEGGDADNVVAVQRESDRCVRHCHIISERCSETKRNLE